MPLTRRAVTAFALMGPAMVAQAQTLPSSGVVTLVVPFPAGGSVDAIARLVQSGLQERLGASVVVENKPGASGSLGAAQVARAAPDGRTWLFVFDTHAVNPSMMRLTFDSEADLEPVMLIGTAPNLITTHPSRPYRTLADAVADAKARPGAITYGTIGNGSLGHLSMELLAKRAGVRMNHVPYRGGGPLLNDAVGGHVDLVVASTALVMPQLRSGGLRGLAQMGLSRIPSLAELPTVAESGFPDFESNAWWGVYGPKGTPAPLAQAFHDALASVLRTERVASQLTENQQVVVLAQGPEDLRRFFRAQAKLWGEVVRENAIVAQ